MEEDIISNANALIETKKSQSLDISRVQSFISITQEYSNLHESYVSLLKLYEELQEKQMNENKLQFSLNNKLRTLKIEVETVKSNKSSVLKAIEKYKKQISEYEAMNMAAEEMYRKESHPAEEIKELNEKLCKLSELMIDDEKEHRGRLKEIRDEYREKVLKAKNQHKLCKLEHKMESRLIANRLNLNDFMSASTLQEDLINEMRKSDENRLNLIRMRKNDRNKVFYQEIVKDVQRNDKFVQFYRFCVIGMIAYILASIIIPS
jgi:hypothetical protein